MAKSVALFLAAALLVAGLAPAFAQGGDNAVGGDNAGGGGDDASKTGGVSAEECRSRLESAGGESALLQRAPSCSVAATAAEAAGSPAGASTTTLDKCCEEVKAFVESDALVPKCLCNQEVWNTARSRIAAAGLTGVNEGTIDAFVKSCGLSVAGSGC